VDCHAGEIHARRENVGKSTLLGIASGFLAPDDGSVDRRASARHRSVAEAYASVWVWPTRPTLGPRMSVAEPTTSAPWRPARVRRHGDLGGEELEEFKLRSRRKCRRKPLAPAQLLGGGALLAEPRVLP
jgi:ABC-type transport system involved in cytochrome c biogenesis ATPase subunit